ncbi:unnamed protein product [Boreogadus saida]
MRYSGRAEGVGPPGAGQERAGGPSLRRPDKAVKAHVQLHPEGHRSSPPSVEVTGQDFINQPHTVCGALLGGDMGEPNRKQSNPAVQEAALTDVDLHS